MVAKRAKKLTNRKPGGRLKLREVCFTVDEALASKADQVLDDRSLTMEEFLTLHLSLLANNPTVTAPIYDLDMPLQFGKYRDIQLGLALKADPRYIIWALGNKEDFAMTPEAFRLLFSLTNDRTYLEVADHFTPGCLCKVKEYDR
jgi:hypothetical protein